MNNSLDWASSGLLKMRFEKLKMAAGLRCGEKPQLIDDDDIVVN
jgi:hypothetical protein